MAEDHGAPEARNFPGPGLEIVERQESRQRVRVHSWTLQNGMKGVLRQVFAGAAGRILDSVNYRMIRA